MKKINICLILTFFFLCACTESTKEYTINFAVTLKNQGHLKTGIVVEFRDDKGLSEIKGHMDRIRYSLYLAFSSMELSDVTGKRGKEKSLNSVKKILKQRLNEEIVRVRFVDFNVTDNT